MNQKIESILSPASEGIFSFSLREATVAHKRKYDVNEKFFDNINSEESAYILGWMYSDGNNDGYYSISIDLNKRDVEILDIFSRFLFSGNSPKYTETCNDSLKLTICSKYVSEKLTEYGCVKAKSTVLKFPTVVSDDVMRHFLRGFLEGDGSIINSNKRYYIFFLGTDEFINKLNEYLITKLDITRTKIIKASKPSFIKRLSITKRKDVLKIINFLYKDSTLVLERKKKIADEFLNKVNSGEIKIRNHTYSSHSGITFDKQKNRWLARDKRKHIGTYASETDAIKGLEKWKALQLLNE